MIKKITIRDVASYDKTGVVLDDLQKVNFIYGGNGTGKTTISRLLASKTPAEDYPTCWIEKHPYHEDTVVYNKDFRDKNFRENIPGVFTIGEEAVEALKDLEEQREKRVELARTIRNLEKKEQFVKTGVALADTRAEYEKTDNYIKETEERLGSVQPTIDSINQALEEMHITGFRIQPSGSHRHYYQIQREDGRPAFQTLSEGEVTIITFLYFMQLVKGFETNVVENKPRVVVIDDPISSLDSQVMYEVSDKIRDLIDEVRDMKDGEIGIEQIILLTHNKAFYRQLTDRQERKDTCYWWLIKKESVSRVKVFGHINPIRGEYATMWLELKDSYESGNYIVIPNLMRKIIETYFVGMGGMNKRRLIPDNFSSNAEEKAIIKSLAKWMDEGSHRVGDDLYVDDPGGMCEKYMKVFKKLFERLGHESHYRMMMGEEAKP